MGTAGVRDNGFNHAASHHAGSDISIMHRSYLLAGTLEFASTLIEYLTTSQQVEPPAKN